MPAFILYIFLIASTQDSAPIDVLEYSTERECKQAADVINAGATMIAVCYEFS